MANILSAPRAFTTYGQKQIKVLEKNGFDVDYNMTGRQYTKKIL